MFAVKTSKLSKSYGSMVCLKECDLEVPMGGVFGLLGPNGAGKSTLLRTLLGFLKITAGKAEVLGFDIASQNQRVRESTSYLPGDPRLFRTMKGSSVVELFAGLHPHSTLKGTLQVAERLELELSRRVMFMSTGMRQKLALAIVLGCKAPLVVLDEPTANLDPNVRSAVLDLIRDVRNDGRTVILSSHIFSDIDETCDAVAVLRDGKIVAQQSMQGLAESHIVSGLVRSQLAEATLAQVQGNPNVSYASLRDERIDGSEDQAPVQSIEMHFRTDPALWLAWLAELPITRMRLERAGIRAIYQQFHSGNPLRLEDETAQ